MKLQQHPALPVDRHSCEGRGVLHVYFQNQLSDVATLGKIL
jgi:hypothetical protein